MTQSPDLEARTQSVRALEAEFAELVNQLRRMMAETAERLSPGLLVGAYKVFTSIVRNDGVTLSALADSLMMDKGQLSRTVHQLEQAGLVHRNPDPTDGRSSRLSPTTEGLERLAAARYILDDSLATTLSDWPIEEIDHLTRLLHALSTRTTP